VTRGAPAISSSRGSAAASAYSVAIEQTTRVIERRAKSFRNLVVVVVLIGSASLVWALVTRSPSGLAGWFFIVPACGFYLVADARLLNDWRSELLARWARRELDLAAFRDAIRAHPALPKDTTEAMLATLPLTEGVVSEQRILPPTRHAAASDSGALHHGRADSILLNAAASAIAASAVAASLWTGTWTPLLGLTTLVLRPAVGLGIRRRRRAARQAEVETCRTQAGFSEADYARLLVSPP